MKIETIIAKTDGKEEAAQHMIFLDMIRTATNSSNITCVHIKDEGGTVLFTRWKIENKG